MGFLNPLSDVGFVALVESLIAEADGHPDDLERRKTRS